MNKEEKKKEEVRQVSLTVRNPFTKNSVWLCVAVAVCAMLPAFAVDAVMHKSPKKETSIIICQFNGGLLGVTCN